MDKKSVYAVQTVRAVGWASDSTYADLDDAINAAARLSTSGDAHGRQFRILEVPTGRVLASLIAGLGWLPTEPKSPAEIEEERGKGPTYEGTYTGPPYLGGGVVSRRNTRAVQPAGTYDENGSCAGEGEL